MEDRHVIYSCSECKTRHCSKESDNYPNFCPTVKARENGSSDEIIAQYIENNEVNTLMKAAAKVEAVGYGKLTRVEEIILFAQSIGAKKIGIASCEGLIREAGIFTEIVKNNGLESICVICKVGSVDKTDLTIPEALKIKPDSFEAGCNPLLQAKTLNNAETDLNIIIGLCVGHDALFSKHSQAPVVTLIAKDRVLGHNPAAALYTSQSYYKRLIRKEL